MARTDTDKLVVELEARVRDFEKGMAKAAGTADRQFGRMNRSAKTAANNMTATMQQAATRINGVLGKLGLGALTGGGSLAGITAALGAVNKQVADIGRTARQAGMDTRSFQELAYVAKANRIEVDSLTSGMRELSLRGAEFFTTGSGSAAEAFKQLGYSAQDVATKLRDPSKFLTEIIGKVQRLDKASQIAIFDKLFGSDGAKFVQLIEQGEQGIRDTIAAAHDMNAVVRDDLVKSAEEIDRQFAIITTTISGWVQPAVIRFLQDVLNLMDRIKPLGNQMDSTLDTDLADIGKRRLQIEKEIAQYRHGAQPADGILGTSIGASTPLEMIADLERENEALAAQEEAIMKVVRARQTAAANAPPVTTLPPVTITGGGGGKPTRDKAAEAADREAAAVRKLIADLEHELSTIGMSNVEKDISNNLRRVNVDAMSAEGQQIADLVRAIDAETEAIERAKEAKEALIESGEAAFGMIGDALGSIADGSVKAEDAIKKLAIQLALAVAQAALLGSGPLGGLFGGGLLGGLPGREHGGPVSAGQPYIVGEKRPEIFVPNTSGRILPRVPEAASGGGGGSVTISVPIQIDAPGADAAALSRVEQQVQKLQRDLPTTVIATVRNAQATRNLR